MRRLAITAVLAVLVLGAAALAAFKMRHLLPPEIADILRPSDITEIRARITGPLTEALAAQGLKFGAPIFIRVFKEEAELELWVRSGETFERFKTYPICNYSGDLGPKLAEGDRQSPEGTYSVSLGSLNPNSRFHLSFNLGFPNAFDRAHGRTGSFLMIHGNCVSVGCYAMTDRGIEEIYVLAEAALRGGQGAFFVHAFPFRMTAARMAQAEGHRWAAFWQELKVVHDAFETTRQVPRVVVEGHSYRVGGL